MHCTALQIEDEVREARRDELVSLQQRLGEEWAKTRVGQEVSAQHPIAVLLQCALDPDALCLQ